METDATRRRPLVTHGALILLLAINLFNYIDRQVLAAVLPEIRHTFFTADDPNALAKSGWLTTAFLVSYMLMAPVFGALADRTSRWMLIAGGVAVWSLASGWSGLAGSFTVLLFTRIFVGIGEAAYGPAAPTIISDLYPVEKRGRTLSFFYLAIPVGSALGYVLGGIVASYWGWRAAFYVVVPPGLLLALLCLLMRDPRGRARHPSNPVPTRRTLRDYLALFRIRSFAFNTAAMTAMTFAIGGIAVWVPTYIYEFRRSEFSPSATLLGEINTTFGAITVVAGLLATLLGGWLGDRLRQRYAGGYFLLSGVAMLLAFPVVISMLRVPFPAAWALIFLAVFLLFLNTGPANAALANVTHPSVRATAFAVNIFIIHALGDAISPPLIGAVADRWNMDAGFLLVSFTILIAGVLWLVGAKYLGADTAKVTATQDGAAATAL